MTYKELDRYRQLKNRIHYIEIELSELAELSAVRLDGMPHSRSPGDPVYQAFRRSEKLRRMLELKKQQAQSELERIIEFIENVDDPEMQNILTARFVEGQTYEKIGEELYMHRTTVKRKIESFLKDAHNAH